MLGLAVNTSVQTPVLHTNTDDGKLGQMLTELTFNSSVYGRFNRCVMNLFFRGLAAAKAQSSFGGVTLITNNTKHSKSLYYSTAAHI